MSEVIPETKVIHLSLSDSAHRLLTATYRLSRSSSYVAWMRALPIRSQHQILTCGEPTDFKIVPYQLSEELLA